MTRTVCFVASNREFLFRHFGPAIDAAKAVGTRVVAVVPDGSGGVQSAVEGVQIVDSPSSRNNNSIRCLLLEALWFVVLLRRQAPSLVVVYSLRMCFVLALVQWLLPACKFVFVITGVGYVGISPSLRARVARNVVFTMLGRVSPARSHFIFENSSDPGFTRIGQRHRVTILMGAGVDPMEFSSGGFPDAPPFRFATASRLVWSKGIDVAADAISALAVEGYPVELHVYGAPDAANPHPVDPASLIALPGVHYHGFCDEMSGVWKTHHAAIFTSRGGEGLPRALIEAAACGRPCIVTAVPGCVDFVRHGAEGYVVPQGSVAALKRSIVSFIASPEQLAVFGAQARRRVLQTSTTAMIQSEYEKIFRILLQERAQERLALGRIPGANPRIR